MGLFSMSSWSTFEPSSGLNQRSAAPEEGEDGQYGIQYNMRDPENTKRVSLELQARFQLSDPPVMHYTKPRSWSIWPLSFRLL